MMNVLNILKAVKESNVWMEADDCVHIHSPIIYTQYSNAGLRGGGGGAFPLLLGEKQSASWKARQSIAGSPQGGCIYINVNIQIFK